MRSSVRRCVSAAMAGCVLSAWILSACGSTVSNTNGAAPVDTTAPDVVTTEGIVEPTTIVIGEPPPITGIAAEIGRRSGDAMRSFDPFSDPIESSLRADQRELAQQFVAEFGDNVAVTLGAFPFPNIDADQTYPLTCPVLPSGEGNGQLEWTLDSGTITSVSGADLSLSVSIKNVTASPFPWSSGGSDVAYVTERGTRRVIGITNVLSTAEGHEGTIEAGATLIRSAYGGTTTCEKSMGWALAPGKYDVYIVFTVSPGVASASGAPALTNYVSPPFPLVISDEKPSLPAPAPVPEITPPPTTGV